ncbi:glycosyltransferase family A protein [Acinetobacter indicus]|uniref:glycosyltransferase family A protein n=1 Tax=Acinetobacter indicus TaxID=756892 RepID=UPI00144429C2|nr:glycosyltransferase family A protein [Acinetobacter indicus]QSG84100.1 glycosyltransferase family 2 protein [Acinetobacter indicus]
MPYNPNINTYDNITLCLTIGKRPLELEKTLQSLLNQVNFKNIIAINDFRDEATNEVFLRLCPQGELINLPMRVGHHLAIDTMYSKVTTEYIFHCEDDWLFTEELEIQKYIALLNQYPQATMICLRKISDFSFCKEELKKIQYNKNNLINLACLNSLHEQWYGYTFNPHITSINTWKQTKGFEKFKKERHISRWFRAKEKYALFLENGICHHIGFESIANPPRKSWFTSLLG